MNTIKKYNEVIYKGTTPTLRFTTNIDTSLLDGCRLAFAQRDGFLYTKTLEDMEVSDGLIECTLSEYDTLLFDEDDPLDMQFRIRYDGEWLDASNIIRVNVGKIIEGGVFKDE